MLRLRWVFIWLLVWDSMAIWGKQYSNWVLSLWLQWCDQKVLVFQLHDNSLILWLVFAWGWFAFDRICYEEICKIGSKDKIVLDEDVLNFFEKYFLTLLKITKGDRCSILGDIWLLCWGWVILFHCQKDIFWVNWVWHWCIDCICFLWAFWECLGVWEYPPLARYDLRLFCFCQKNRLLRYGAYSFLFCWENEFPMSLRPNLLYPITISYYIFWRSLLYFWSEIWGWGEQRNSHRLGWWLQSWFWLLRVCNSSNWWWESCRFWNQEVWVHWW